MKSKLLYLSQCFPIPTDGGGTIKTFNTIKTLSKKFDIYAIFISERAANMIQKHYFSKLGVKVKVFKTHTMIESVKSNYWRLIWNYLQLRPHFVYQYRYIPGIKYIKKLIKKWRPDIIHVDHINSSQFLPSHFWLRKNLGYIPKLVLENHNLNHVIFRTRFYETKKPIRKVYLFLEGFLNYLYGVVNYPRYDHIFSISDEETEYLKKHYKSVSTQPLVYPLIKKNASRRINKKYDILFIGNLTWPPNEVGIMWFLDDIFPHIKKKIPHIGVYIVGKYNVKFDKYKNIDGVFFYGYVKNINNFLDGARVFILPFKTGAGVRIKSLTALQSGIPIVSTRMGIEGLHLSNRQEFLLAESNNLFAKSVITLINDKKLWTDISINEKMYFRKNHLPNKNRIFLEEYIRLLTSKTKKQ